MQQVARIKQDKSVKPRLIWACLGVALLVSAIYVTVSYRLTADISVQSELKAMSNSISLIGRQLAQQDTATDINEILRLIIEPADATPGFISITSGQQQWHARSNLSEQALRSLNEAIAQITDSSRPIDVNGNSYLWQQHQAGAFTITYVQQTTALDITLGFVAKRLLITSIIVFWIAVWLALTLASLISKRAEEINDTLAHIATHDSLTGLPNRLYLLETLENALVKDCPHQTVNEGCLLIIDLDKFKEVNDSFGYAAGDILLQEVGRRLTSLIQPPSEVIRTGGDEFIIWAPETSQEEAQQLALDIVELLNEPILIHGLTVNSGASIGIAHYPSQTDNPDGLIVCADTAMHKAKDMRSGWALYDEQNVADYKDILQLRAELSDAITQSQIVLYYQPKVDLFSGQVIGVEG